MKIVQITTFFHPVVGGVESHVFNLSRELLAQGHEVIVLTSDSDKVSKKRIQEKHSTLAGIKIFRFRSWFSFSYFHKFFPGIFWYLLRNDFDIVHVHGFRKIETYFALLASKLKRKKIFLTTHNPFPTTSYTPKQLKFLHWHDKTIGKWFTKRLDKIITIVPSEKNLLTEQFRVKQENLTTIPNGLEEFFFTEGNANEFYKKWDIKADKWNSIVVMAGRINSTKGFQLLAQATRKLPDTLFFIAGGDDGYLSHLQELYSKKRNVILTERYLAKEDLINMYAGGSVFVAPSLHEPFGIVILEAMAQGLPIIVSDTAGPKEFLDPESAIFVSIESESKWTDALTDLLKHPQRMKQMGAYNREIVKKYHWSKVAKKIIKVYNEQNPRNRNSK